jgi:hypothetical protein
MKPKYLGDCLDFYKRWFLKEFFPNERLLGVPMLTESWNDDAQAQLYSALIGVDVVQREIIPNRRDRSDYFQALADGGIIARNVFLDPDTGLRVGCRPKGRRFDEYLFDHELNHILQDSDRVAVIYDHSIARGAEVEFAEQKLRALCAKNYSAFAYCAQVAMVVVSRSRNKISAIYHHATLLSHLPPHRIVSNFDY